MILKKYQQALELPSIVANTSLVQMLLKKKIIGLRNGLLIPDKLIAEIEEYTNRNSLLTNKSGKISCPSCLKAHLIKKAEQFGLDSPSLKYISSIFKGAFGHNGYYLDEETLIKI